MDTRKLFHYNGDPNEPSSIRDNHRMTVARGLHHEDAAELVKRWNAYPELVEALRRSNEWLDNALADEPDDWDSSELAALVMQNKRLLKA